MEYVKETYALFGLAYYFSEVLHRSLCNYQSSRHHSEVNPFAGHS